MTEYMLGQLETCVFVLRSFARSCVFRFVKLLGQHFIKKAGNLQQRGLAERPCRPPSDYD